MKFKSWMVESKSVIVSFFGKVSRTDWTVNETFWSQSDEQNRYEADTLLLKLLERDKKRGTKVTRSPDVELIEEEKKEKEDVEPVGGKQIKPPMLEIPIQYKQHPEIVYSLEPVSIEDWDREDYITFVDRSPDSFDEHVHITKVKYLPELWKWYRYNYECKRHGKFTDRECPTMLNIDDVTKLVDANSTELGQDGSAFYTKSMNIPNCSDALRWCASANEHKNLIAITDYSNWLKQFTSSIKMMRYPEDYVVSQSGTMGD